MVAIGEKRTQSARKIDEKRSVGRYVAVGLAAVVLGVGSVWGSIALVGGGVEDAARQAAQIRGSLVDEHLDSIWASGLAQQQAIREARALQSRIEGALAAKKAIESRQAFEEAWRMRGEEMANHLDALNASGLAQRKAMGLE